MVVLLLAAGAEVNQTDGVSNNYVAMLCLCYFLFVFLQDGQTALHFAAMNGHDKVVELLLAAGAKVNKNDEVSYFCS